MTEEEAVLKAESGWWKDSTSDEIVEFQLYEERLCMDFSAFHAAIEDVLGRPVFTHEFGLNRDGLMEEYQAVKAKRTR